MSSLTKTAQLLKVSISSNLSLSRRAFSETGFEHFNLESRIV